MHIEPSQKARDLNLKPGEWQLFCPDCHFKVEKNTAAPPVCPDCGSRLHVAREDGNAHANNRLPNSDSRLSRGV